MKNIKPKNGLQVCIILIIILTLLTPAVVIQATANTTTKNETDWWPMYGHDLRHTGFSSSRAPETNRTLFSTQLLNHGSPTTAYSGVTLANGKFYFTCTGTNQLICADAFTGDLLWNRSPFQDAYFSPPIADGRAYQFGYTPEGDNTALYCLNADNGSTVWMFILPYYDEIFSSPVVLDGKIYFGTMNSGFYCVYTTNGTQTWSTNVGHTFNQPGSSPAIWNDKVYAVASDWDNGPTYVDCYNATNGNLIWTYYTVKGPGKTPTIADGKVYIDAGNTMFCLDAVGNGDGTTTLAWSKTVTGSLTSSATAYGNVYFGSSNQRMYCFNTTTHHEIWNYSMIGTPTTPALAANKIYTVTTEYSSGANHNRLYCLNALGTGNGATNVIWQYALPENNVEAHAQPTIGNNSVIIVTDNNWVYAFNDNHWPNRPPPPSGPSQGSTGVAYAFTASTTDPDNNNISYMWDWGDGIFSAWSSYLPSGSPLTESHRYNNTGTYFVRVKARDELEFTTVWSIGLMIVIATYQQMVIDAGGPYSGLTGEPILFTGSVTGGAPPYHWSWNFGNGQTNETQNPSYAYPTAGNYTVTLTVTDAAQQSVSDTSTATIHVPAVPKLIIDTITGGFGVTAVIKNNGTVNVTNITWNITLDGGFLPRGQKTTGTIARLAVGNETTIKSSFIFGLGQTTITVSAIGDGGTSAEKTASGFVLLFLVLGVK